MDVDSKTEQAIWMPTGQHAAENVGKLEAHNVVIEIKK